MRWMVQLAGDTSDLSTLAQSFTGTDVNLLHDGQNYVLTSDTFQDVDDANTIRAKAENIVELLNGATRLALDAGQAIRIGAVYRDRLDGTREICAFFEPLVIHCRAIAPTVKGTHADGTVKEFHRADLVRAWSRLALSDNAVGNVLRILGSRTLDWVNLYRIFEIVATDVGGKNSIAANGWATINSMNLFKHTANSPGALGLEARHGALSSQPPPKPMTISEARSLVNSIIVPWLGTKVDNP